MAAVPIERHLLFQTNDIDEARERVGKVFCRHRIDFGGRGRSLSARQYLVQLGHLALSYVTYGEEVEIDAGEPGNFFMVHCIDHGHTEMKVGRSTLVSNARMGTVSSATLGLRMRWSANCGHLVLKVERPALERHLSDLLGDGVIRPIEFAPELPAESGPGTGFRRMIDFLSLEFERDDTFFASPLGIHRIEQTLMTLLLTTLPNNYAAALSAQASPAAPRHVLRAEEYIRANAERAITIGEIAQAAGVSARTLFEGFQRFRGTTPLAMLKNVRLERVYAELKQAGPSACVTTVALKWGFVHLSRFAQMYRSRYGELPSQTLRRWS